MQRTGKARRKKSSRSKSKKRSRRKEGKRTASRSGLGDHGWNQRRGQVKKEKKGESQ